MPSAPQRPPPRHRRRLVAAAAGGAVLVAVVVWPRGDDTVEPPPDPVRPPDPVTVYSPRGLDETVLLGAPVGVDSGGSMVSIDVAAGTSTLRLRDLPVWPGDFPHPMVVVGDRVVWADLSAVWSMPFDLGEPPQRIGDALMLVPSRSPGRVWAIEREPMRAIEIDGFGTVHTDGAALPAGASPVTAVAGGLLLVIEDDLVVWSPATGSTTRVYDARGVLAASSERVYLDGGVLVHIATGEVSFLGRRPRAAEAAAFSTDGTHLAVFGQLEHVRDVGVTIYELEPEVRARQFHQLLSVTTVVGNRLVWSPDGDAVYLAVSDRADGSADRVLGISVALRGSAQTIASVRLRGFYWLAVG